MALPSSEDAFERITEGDLRYRDLVGETFVGVCWIKGVGAADGTAIVSRKSLGGVVSTLGGGLRIMRLSLRRRGVDEASLGGL